MLYPPKASVLGFLLRSPARDAVRGFCATFATKSGKEKGDKCRPLKAKSIPTALSNDKSWQDGQTSPAAAQHPPLT